MLRSFFGSSAFGSSAGSAGSSALGSSAGSAGSSALGSSAGSAGSSAFGSSAGSSSFGFLRKKEQIFSHSLAKKPFFLCFTGVSGSGGNSGLNSPSGSFSGFSFILISCHVRTSEIISRYRSRLRSADAVRPRSISLSSTM